MYSERRRNEATKTHFILDVTVLVKNKFIYISSCYAKYKKMKMGTLVNCHAIPNCSKAKKRAFFVQWNILVTVISLESVPNVWNFFYRESSVPFHYLPWNSIIPGFYGNFLRIIPYHTYLLVSKLYFVFVINGKHSVQSAAQVLALYLIYLFSLLFRVLNAQKKGIGGLHRK